jgi:hypothetical protein
LIQRLALTACVTGSTRADILLRRIVTSSVPSLGEQVPDERSKCSEVFIHWIPFEVHPDQQKHWADHGVCHRGETESPAEAGLLVSG